MVDVMHLHTTAIVGLGANFTTNQNAFNFFFLLRLSLTSQTFQEARGLDNPGLTPLNTPTSVTSTRRRVENG